MTEPRLKVLVVDDILKDLETVAEFFQQHRGCDVAVAGSAGKAIDQLRANSYDILAIDLDLRSQGANKDATVLSVLRVAAAMPLGQSPAIVVISGAWEDRDFLEYLKMNAPELVEHITRYRPQIVIKPEKDKDADRALLARHLDESLPLRDLERLVGQPERSRNIFAHVAGNTWRLRFGGTEVTRGFSHLTGMVYLRTLLGKPGQPISVVELTKEVDGLPAPGEGPALTGSGKRRRIPRDHGAVPGVPLEAGDVRDSGEIRGDRIGGDWQAIEEYKAELYRLAKQLMAVDDRIAEEQESGDDTLVSDLRSERKDLKAQWRGWGRTLLKMGLLTRQSPLLEWDKVKPDEGGDFGRLEHELAKLGRANKPERKRAEESIRTTVRNAVEDAVEEIASVGVHPSLGKHLDLKTGAIKMGACCRYIANTVWEVVVVESKGGAVV